MFRKIYLFAILIAYFLEILMKISVSSRALKLLPNYYELIFLGVWAILNIVGMYGFMFGKKIASGLFWKIYFIISSALFISSVFGDIKGNFISMVDYYVEFAFLLFIIPNYIFLFLYGYRFDWGERKGR